MDLYIGNLPPTATAADLTKLFAPFGAVDRAQIKTDGAFGLVRLAAGGEQAIAATHGSEYRGNTLTVRAARTRRNHANDRPPHPAK
jgi:hypothetical protein